MQRSRTGRTDNSRTNGSGVPEGRAKQRAFCIAVLPDGDDLSELKELLRTARVAVVGETVQHLEQPHPRTYLGSGKLEEVKEAAKAADANVIVCDDELSPSQERNIEEALKLPVIDRTELILDIFAGHANSAEGKLQVELAQLKYAMPRLGTKDDSLSRLTGGIGGRGPGETKMEIGKRRAKDRLAHLEAQLRSLGKQREQRRRRRARRDVASVAIVGYTNAGKSTLLNRLTGAEVSVRDRLFHTLDPTTRTMELHGRAYLLTDTVGFIRKLPHQLVEAFGATLDETRLADLVLHVVDASAPEDEMVDMLRAVDEVLEDIGAGDNPRILVLNKADAIDDDRRGELLVRHPDGVLVSAVTGEGLEELGERIEQEFRRRLRTVDVLLPYAEGARLAELHEVAGDDLRREDTPTGVRVSARVPAAMADRLEPFTYEANGANGA